MAASARSGAGAALLARLEGVTTRSSILLIDALTRPTGALVGVGTRTAGLVPVQRQARPARGRDHAVERAKRHADDSAPRAAAPASAAAPMRAEMSQRETTV